MVARLHRIARFTSFFLCGGLKSVTNIKKIEEKIKKVFLILSKRYINTITEWGCLWKKYRGHDKSINSY